MSRSLAMTMGYCARTHNIEHYSVYWLLTGLVLFRDGYIFKSPAYKYVLGYLYIPLWLVPGYVNSSALKSRYRGWLSHRVWSLSSWVGRVNCAVVQVSRLLNVLLFCFIDTGQLDIFILQDLTDIWNLGTLICYYGYDVKLRYSPTRVKGWGLDSQVVALPWDSRNRLNW